MHRELGTANRDGRLALANRFTILEAPLLIFFCNKRNLSGWKQLKIESSLTPVDKIYESRLSHLGKGSRIRGAVDNYLWREMVYEWRHRIGEKVLSAVVHRLELFFGSGDFRQ
jgi:hypothetical protein